MSASAGSSTTSSSSASIGTGASGDKAGKTQAASSATFRSQGGSPGSAAAMGASSASVAASVDDAPVVYPCGWLVADCNGIVAGEPLQVLSLPDMGLVGHRGGEAVAADEQVRMQADWPVPGELDAVVEQHGNVAVVPCDWLLVNLPDVLPEACFDIVYSYSSTSNCAGQAIPGVTGECLPGYVNGPQDNPYWAAPRFVAPCAYRTALKAGWACENLANRGYRLLVYDAYRPMSAQWHLSNSFENAFWNNETLQASLGSWSLNWYVANGPSGHNYGSDLDVGVCDLQGNPLPMPSLFDSFDETGHLTAYPLNSYDITPAAYRSEVADNDACSALHEAFVSAGFSELASEWWHFGDGETEASLRALVGQGGLDFVATCASAAS